MKVTQYRAGAKLRPGDTVYLSDTNGRVYPRAIPPTRWQRFKWWTGLEKKPVWMPIETAKVPAVIGVVVDENTIRISL